MSRTALSHKVMGPSSQNWSPTITSVLLQQFAAHYKLIHCIFIIIMSSIPAMSSSVDFIPILQVGVSWATWSSRMQGELERTSVWYYVSGDITIPPPPCQLIPDAAAGFAVQVQLCWEHQELKHAYEDALKADDKAKGLIKKYLAADQLLTITSLKTSKEIWDKLKTIHIATSTGVIAFYIKVEMM